MDKALVERTLKVIEFVSEWDSIKPYILVGGTALSLQLEHVVRNKATCHEFGKCRFNNSQDSRQAQRGEC
jgi:hypothetical protein